MTDRKLFVLWLVEFMLAMVVVLGVGVASAQGPTPTPTPVPVAPGREVVGVQVVVVIFPDDSTVNDVVLGTAVAGVAESLSGKDSLVVVCKEGSVLFSGIGHDCIASFYFDKSGVSMPLRMGYEQVSTAP